MSSAQRYPSHVHSSPTVSPNDVITKLCILTQTRRRQQPDGAVRGVAVRKERFGSVLGERQGYDALSGGPYDEDRDPETEERGQGPECDVYVGVVTPGPGYWCAQFGVTQSSQRGEDAREGPDDDGRPYGFRALVDAGRRHEDSAPDYGPWKTSGLLHFPRTCTENDIEIMCNAQLHWRYQNVLNWTELKRKKKRELWWGNGKIAEPRAVSSN